MKVRAVLDRGMVNASLDLPIDDLPRSAIQVAVRPVFSCAERPAAAGKNGIARQN
jgi:hypothetical protein